jgi:DNA-binding transcriptional LysR family regulator
MSTLPTALPTGMLPSAMPPIHLPQLMAFEVVARHLNFARAAQELTVTPTAISKTIKQLEGDLGVRLFNRTTRSVALTEAGTRLIDLLAPALIQIRSAVGQVSASTLQPAGLLRINTSQVAHASLIAPYMPQFLERYPEITLDVQIDNALSDIVAGGFDAGIRLGEALQRDMIAVPLGPSQQMVVVGSPQYLAQHGEPRKPKDLLDHHCIRQRLGQGGRFVDWEFTQGGKTTRIDVRGRLLFSEMHSVLGAAVQGCGLAYVFHHYAAQEIRDGKLSVLLKRYSPPSDTFYVYYSGRRHMPGKLRAFIDFIRAASWDVPG